MRLYKIAVDSWPTDDGKPWPRFINGPGGGAYAPCPDIEDVECAWFDRLSPWIKAQFSAGDAEVVWDYGSQNIGTFGWVLPITSRRHYLSRTAAQRWVDRANLLGAKARLIPSAPITWDD